MDLSEIVLYHIAAEAVDRRDLRMVDQDALLLQVFILRAFRKAGGQCRCQTVLHFSRRCPRKGHNEQAVDIYGMHRVRDHADDPFHEDCRFTRSGRRGDKQTAAAVIDHFPLLRCPFPCHRLPPFSYHQMFQLPYYSLPARAAF